MKPIKIVVADDQALVREGLRTLLDMEEDMEVVGAACNGLEACEMVEQHKPDIVLLDIQMPLMDGISALKRIKQIRPSVVVLIMTTFIETDYIVEGMTYGGNGYMLKDAEIEKMLASIRDAMAGQFILPAQVAAKLANRLSEWQNGEGQSSERRDRIRLTRREKELARLIVTGANNREIAEKLVIAEGTVRNYMSRLYDKLAVEDRAQAIVKLQSLL